MSISYETYTSVAKEGTVTFTLIGESHSVKVLDIKEDSATIEVSSIPKQLTLSIGQSEEVDINDDGVNDLIVTLNSITNGKADLSLKEIEVITPPSETVKQEPVIVPSKEVKPNYAWLWVTLIVIVVVLVIWYLGRKK